MIFSFGRLVGCGALGACLLVPTLAAAVDEEAAIQIKPIVEVDGSKAAISLGDLLVTRGIHEADLSALRAIKLADTPNPGESRSFTQAALDSVLRSGLHEIEARTGTHVSLRIPNRVTIVRKVFALRAPVVETRLREGLKEICADCEFEIAGLSLPVIANASAGAEWSIRLHNELPKGSFSLPLEVAGDEGAAPRTYWITGTLTVQKRVPVASRSIAIGEHMRPEDFNYQLRDVTFATDTAPNEGELQASIVGRALNAGQIVWRSSLRREAAVKNGDIVKVMAGEDGWQVTIDGIAQGTGYVGDRVNVKIPRTQKLISGLLTDRGVVEVKQ